MQAVMGMVLNATFNNISAISWWWMKPKYPEKISDLLQVAGRVWITNQYEKHGRKKLMKKENTQMLEGKHSPERMHTRPKHQLATSYVHNNKIIIWLNQW